MAPTNSLSGLSRSLPMFFHEAVFGVEYWQYLALGLLVALSLVARTIIHRVVFARVSRIGQLIGQRWMMRLVDVCSSPGATVVMAILLRISYPALDLPQEVDELLASTVRILIAVGITWAGYLCVDLLSDRMAERASQTDSKLDDQLVPLLRKSLKVIAIISGTLLILQNMQVDVGSLVAGLGIGGLAFALAAKDTLANFFGSIMIFIDRPFQIGDWVQAGSCEGIVEEVGFRSTRIRTFYNSLVTLPNSVFTEAKIDNFGARQFRRTSVTLSLTYDTTPDQMQAFVEGIREVIKANEYTRKDYYEVHMAGFGAHSLDVMLYFFFKVADWSEELRERHNVYLEIMRLAQRLGVRFAYPTQTLHIDSVAAPLPGQAKQPSPSRSELGHVVRAFGPGGELSQPHYPPIQAADRA